VSAKPIRVQLSRKRGWRMPENTVNVAGPGRWGNPFLVADFGREEAVRLFAGIADGGWSPDLVKDYDDATANVIYCIRSIWVARIGYSVEEHAWMELRGRNLACWCPLPKEGEPDLCHAAVLLEIVNR
jgi:hypothetical protein